MHKEKIWHCFIPLMVEIPTAILLVFLCGHFEINSFYNDPEHIGFAVPIVTFLLAGFFFLLTLILLIVCIVRAVNRSKKQKEANSDTFRQFH